MLTSLRLARLGIITDARLELGPGLNVITGETGAGKTMLLSGLGLLLGSRADSTLVQQGHRRALVEGVFDLPADHPAVARAQQAGADVAADSLRGERDDAGDGGAGDDGAPSDGGHDQPGIELIVVRQVGADGRSRAHLGGTATPIGTLSDIGRLTVAVHGQADQWRLRRTEEHRALLDHVAGAAVTDLRVAFTQAYRHWHRLRQQLAELTHSDAETTLRREMLSAALAEIEAVDPQPGEVEALASEAARLEHSEGLIEAARTAHGALLGDDAATPGESVSELLAVTQRALERESDHDERLAALRDRVAELGYLAADIGADLSGYLGGLNADPARLEAVHQRRAELARLLRRYGPNPSDLQEWRQRASDELAAQDNVEVALQELQAAESQSRLTLSRIGAELTQARTVAAADLSDRASEELGHLAMGSAQLVVQVNQQPEPGGIVDHTGREVHASEDGLDQVEILLSANRGEPPRTVSKAASGGELSRVMLALEVVGADPSVPTFVFDEVDAGVGGEAALDIGARLAALARHSQVVVVTHLAQVAAFADRHHVVAKSSDGAVTTSDVREVRDRDRVVELARMLGGVTDSDAALAHATELLHEHAPHRAKLSGRATMSGL